MRRAFVLLVVVAAAASGARASEPELVSFRCNGGAGSIGAVRSVEAMENSYIEGTGYGGCWFHTGHHTYDLGSPYAFGRVAGSLFTVETLFSPPTDVGTPNALDRNTPAYAFIEVSLDGVAWSTLRTIPYNFRINRQEVLFDFDAGGAVARFVRVRQPRSAAQGLSGFLDSSNFDAWLTSQPTTPVVRRGEAFFTCEQHVMERFFDTHPCWFGGINRYDSPSVFHTYAIGDASLERVAGRVTFGPWRTDDYYYDGGAFRSLEAYVQVSANGVDWTTLGAIKGPYGESIKFEFEDIAPLHASFVRIVAEYMEDPRRHPALKHVRGFILDSSIEIYAS